MYIHMLMPDGQLNCEQQMDQVEDELNAEILGSSHSGCQIYLVEWKDCPIPEISSHGHWLFLGWNMPIQPGVLLSAKAGEHGWIDYHVCENPTGFKLKPQISSPFCS
ncbi:hypothetical protein U1Q18_012687 [Sarracenia purpurea var. burkii]